MSYYKLFYHFVWSTYNRCPLLVPHIQETVYGAIIEKAARLGAYTHALNGIEDHVHLVVTVPPSIALSTFIGQVKGISSYSANLMHPSDTADGFAWQDEYGVLSFAERDLPAVVRYVRLQQQHHKRGTLKEKLERCE